MGEVGTLCSGLPGCCWGRGQGGRGSGSGKRGVGVGVEGEIPIVFAVLDVLECVCLDLLVTGGRQSLGREQEEMEKVHHLIITARQVCC